MELKRPLFPWKVRQWFHKTKASPYQRMKVNVPQQYYIEKHENARGVNEFLVVRKDKCRRGQRTPVAIHYNIPCAMETINEINRRYVSLRNYRKRKWKDSQHGV